MKRVSQEAKTAVFVAITQESQILLSRRQNTGWLDGFYDMPSGHLEPEETVLAGAARELKEETGLDVEHDDLELFHVCQNHMTPGNPYLFFMLRARKWSGEPAIMEPERSDDLGFFPLDALPNNVLPYVEEALRHLGSKVVSFSYFGPDSMPK